MNTALIYGGGGLLALVFVALFARLIWRSMKEGIQSEPIIEQRESERDQAQAGLDAHQRSDATPDDLARVLRDLRDEP